MNVFLKRDKYHLKKKFLKPTRWNLRSHNLIRSCPTRAYIYIESSALGSLDGQASKQSSKHIQSRTRDLKLQAAILLPRWATDNLNDVVMQPYTLQFKLPLPFFKFLEFSGKLPYHCWPVQRFFSRICATSWDANHTLFDFTESNSWSSSGKLHILPGCYPWIIRWSLAQPWNISRPILQWCSSCVRRICSYPQ